MKHFIVCATFVLLAISSCNSKKTSAGQSPDSTQTIAAGKRSLPDSIEQMISTYDRRLDIKMRRKTYEPRPGSLVTFQKWFEYGDTTRLVKLREETITGDTKMEVIQYHFLGQQVAEIHDYLYDKKHEGKPVQYMREAKYFFKNGALASAVQRESIGTNDSVPVIERAAFVPFQPGKALLAAQKDRLEQINATYASLPYKALAKPR